MSVIYGRVIVLNTGSGGGFVVSKTQPEKTNLLWIDPDTGLTRYFNGSEWAAIAGVYAEEGTV